MQVDNIVGQHQDTPTDCSINGCGWQESMRFTVPDTWRPGGYLITLRAERGGDFVEEYHLILIRSAPAQKRPRYLLVCATGTWQAYNCWGGSNHYEGIAGKDAVHSASIKKTPAACAAAKQSALFCALRVMGFSHKTCLPAPIVSIISCL